eukprot:TRINITY_DN12756_c0_g4_i1.p1 TRINITY_DN12756_c0_g4~~TRINITY_DN12756_c0_g4_i1.p1  ORF type:complete len:752 (+),score=434.69 TRINITY_DN12756_c0_g4_i1:52-2256(+)
MEFESYFILDEFERKINDEFQDFLKQFDPEFAAQYPVARLSNDLSKGDFSIMLKGVSSQKSAINEDDLKGLNPKEQKAKKVELQLKYAEKFTNDLITAFDTYVKNKPNSVIQRVEITAGFLNMFVSRDIVFGAGINAIINRLGDNFGKCDVQAGKKVVIEHTSSNPNGPLHIGNLRNVMLGGHLAELFKSVGYDVKQHFYVNDLGAQIGLTALGYQRIYQTLQPKLKIDQWIGMIYAVMNTFNELQKVNIKLNDVYQTIKQKKQVTVALAPAADDANAEKINEYLDIIDDLYTRQPELTVLLLKVCRNSNVKTEAAALNLAYERNEPQAVEIFRNMVSNCLSGVQKTLDTYNIKHDVFDFESELGWEGSNDRVMEVMKASPYFVPATEANDKGVPEGGYLALKDYIQDKGFKLGKGGFQHDYPNFYVLRPDGSTLYTFRDVVYSLKKVGNADLAFNVIASEQNLPQQKVSLSLNLLDPAAPQKQFHVSYELVKLLRNGVVAKMSGRRGRYLLADDLYLELKDTVKDLMVQKYKEKAGGANALNLDSPEDQAFLETTSTEVATATMKYTLLATGSRHLINFDIVKAADTEESNSGAYLLYNTTRFFSIFRRFEDGIKEGKWGPLPSFDQINFSRLSSTEEWRLFLKYAMAFPKVVYETACPRLVELPGVPEFATNRLCEHLMALAQDFSKYYAKHRILNADDTELMYARLYWAQSLKQIMVNGLRILTIIPVQKM